MKHKARTMVVALFMVVSLAAGANVFFPTDMPTITALIELHKGVAKQQSRAVARIGKSAEGQLLIKQKAENIENNTTTMRSRTNNVHSWVILAGTLTKAANEIDALIKEYTEFQTTTYNAFKQNSQALWYYQKSNEDIAREIKRARQVFTGLAGTSVMQATMAERLQLAYRIVDIIETARRIIYRASIYVTTMVPHDNIFITLQNSLSEEDKNALIKQTVSTWKKSSK